MSLTTWTQEELSSNRASVDGDCWRAVEAQHRVSTMKLVDTREEQELLEDIVESTKPPVPPSVRDFDYLLFTPFRYGAPYPRGSRFRRPGMTLGVYYACEYAETAIAEIVFCRFLFFAESSDTDPPSNPSEYTVFSARVRSSAVVDLTAPPLDKDHTLWTDPNDYAPCQEIADKARACKTEIIKYQSVRDPAKRANYAVLEGAAFASGKITARQSWHIHLKKDGALALCESPPSGVSFRLVDFSADKRLAELASRAP